MNINYNENIFTILSNDTVWNKDSEGSTLIKDFGSNVVAILSYINSKENRRGYSEFTLEEVIKYCNMKPNSHKGKINDQFKDILISMTAYNLLVELDDSLTKCSAKSIIKVKFNVIVDKEFFKIDTNSIDLIMQVNKCDNMLVLNVYSYILARMNRRTGVNAEAKLGRAECVYATEDVMADNLSISKTTFIKAINILQELELIYVDNIGLVKRGKKTSMANNLYVVDKSEMELALEQSKYHYSNEGYIIVGKKTTKELKEINGLAGRIKQMQEQGMEVKDLEKKLNKLTNDKANKEAAATIEKNNHNQIKNEREENKRTYKTEDEVKVEAKTDKAFDNMPQFNENPFDNIRKNGIHRENSEIERITKYLKSDYNGFDFDIEFLDGEDIRKDAGILIKRHEKTYLTAYLKWCEDHNTTLVDEQNHEILRKLMYSLKKEFKNEVARESMCKHRPRF